MDDKKHKETMLKVAKNLVNENVKDIKYYCSDIGDGILENINSPIDLIKKLEHQGVLGVNNYGKFVKLLNKIGRDDLVKYFPSELISKRNINNERKIPYGGVFQFDLQEDEVCILVEYKCGKHDNWISISNKKQPCAYYLSRRKKKEFFVKIENFIANENIDFRFSLQGSKSTFYEYRTCNITGNCNYELSYSSIMIATAEPIFNNQFNENIRIPNSLDWRKAANINFDKVPFNESIESFAQNYIERNFPEINDVICVHSILGDKNFTGLVVDKFYHLFSANKTGVCGVLPGYPLRYHASLLKCNIESFKSCKDEDRIIVFHSELNLVLIARIATSLDGIKLESENCLNDIILFINVNSPLIKANKLVILGIVVLPSFERKKLKEELFFLFSDSFTCHSSDLEQILFLCKDDIEGENFEGWWRSVAAYCAKKFSVQSNSTIFFKKLIGFTMILMAKVDHSLPTLESNTQKQIKSLVLNYEQLVAIHDKKLKKIISGGYGSGKSVVGKEIVKNCITTITESPLTLYYICCNNFSFFECEMKEFVDSLEKSSNVTVVCDNLYELWKTMCINKGISEEYISIPKLLEYLFFTNNNKVCFILEELSPDYVKKEDAIRLNKLFSSVLKETLVVFIPESVEKYRVLTRNKKECLIQKNYFNEKALAMNVYALNKTMRVTELNKLLIDSSQDSICESKTICNFPNSNENRISQINREEKSDQIKNSYSSTGRKDELCKLKSNDMFVYNSNDDSVIHISNKKVERNIDKTGKEFHEYDYDHVSKYAAIQTNGLDSSCVMETSYVFKQSTIGHSIKGEKPKVVYFPFHDITKKRAAKFLSVVLENLCFSVLRKTVVICNSIEEVKSVAYAIDIIGIYKSVPYSPHLRKYTPKLAEKVEVLKKLKSNFDILVTDSKGFSGVESESVIVLVKPDEYQYLRHVLVDAMARSNSHLIVLILDFVGNNNGNIRNVLNNWSEDIVEKIIVHISNEENQFWTIKGQSLIISEDCKDFIDRGSQRKFGDYKNNIEFRVFHENNSVYETMAFDIQASKVIKNEIDESQPAFDLNPNKGMPMCLLPTNQEDEKPYIQETFEYSGSEDGDISKSVLTEELLPEKPAGWNDWSKNRKKNYKKKYERQRQRMKEENLTEKDFARVTDPTKWTEKEREAKLNSIKATYSLASEKMSAERVDYISLLQIVCQKIKWNLPEYKECTSSYGSFGYQCRVGLKCYESKDFNSTKNDAKHNAAKWALLELDIPALDGSKSSCGGRTLIKADVDTLREHDEVGRLMQAGGYSTMTTKDFISTSQTPVVKEFPSLDGGEDSWKTV